MNILSFIIVSILYVYGLFALYITYLAKVKGDRGAFINNLANSIILIGSITVSLILTNLMRITSLDFIKFPFDIFMILFILLILIFFYLSVFREKRIIRFKVDSWRKYYSTTSNVLPFKYELYRKLTHFVVLIIIFFYFTLGFWVQNILVFFLDYLPNFISDIFFSFYNLESDKMIFTQYLVVFLVGGSLVGLLTADFTRILKPAIYPLKPVNLLLRKKEIFMRLGPQISMGVGCFSIIIVFGLFQPLGPLVICTSMTMSIVGDATANLIGRKFGHHLIHGSKKTYEGLFTGMLSSFLIGVITLLLLNQLIGINITHIFLIPLIGSLLIGVLDYFDLEIDDNLTFIFVLTSVLFFIAILI